MFIKDFSANVHSVAYDIHWNVIREVVGDASSSNRMRTHCFLTFLLRIVSTAGAGFVSETGCGHFIHDPPDGGSTHPAVFAREQRFAAVLVCHFMAAGLHIFLEQTCQLLCYRDQSLTTLTVFQVCALIGPMLKSEQFVGYVDVIDVKGVHRTDP